MTVSEIELKAKNYGTFITLGVTTHAFAYTECTRNTVDKENVRDFWDRANLMHIIFNFTFASV